MQSIFVAEYAHVKRSVVKDKHIKIKPRIYVLFVIGLDDKCDIIENEKLVL